MEPVGKFVKERLEVVLLRNHLADFEQRLELSPGLREERRRGDFRSGIWQIRHEQEDSIRFTGPTTERTLMRDCGSFRILVAQMEGSSPVGVKFRVVNRTCVQTF